MRRSTMADTVGDRAVDLLFSVATVAKEQSRGKQAVASAFSRDQRPKIGQHSSQRWRFGLRQSGIPWQRLI